MRFHSIAWLFSAAVFLSSCLSTRMGEKGAYLEQDKVYASVKRIPEISLISIARAGDEAMYQQICTQVQSVLLAKGIPSDMRFLKESDGEVVFEKARQDAKHSALLRINPIISSTLRDEMNNPFYVNQALVTLAQSSGEKLAEFVIRIDKDGRTKTQAKEMADVITRYLSKKGWIK
jgi:hypothetical protein